MSIYPSFQNELTTHDVDLHPSELHGLLVGYICGAKSDSRPAQRLALYGGWVDGRASDELVVLLETAYTDALENLDEYADFDFRLLMPDDEQPIFERAKAIGLWCSGFLSGLGESGRRIELTDGDVREVLNDLGRIAAMTDEVPEGEENEGDLIEIEEFVRISVLLVFAETGTTGTH